MVHLSFALRVTETFCRHFLRERLRGQSVLAVGCYLSVYTCEYDASTRCAWVARITNWNKIYQKKEQKQVSIGWFLKTNLADVWILQCMNTLAN